MLAKVFLAAVASLALALGALLWFAGTETALRWIAQRAVAASGGRLRLEGVHGSVYGPLHIDLVVFETGRRRLELRRLDLDWSPRALLLQRRLEVRKLDVQALTVNIKAGGKEPLQLPRTLRLPLALALPDVAVGRIGVTVAGASYELGRLRFRLQNPGDTYRLDLPGVDTPWGGADGELRLAASPPFALQGRLSVAQKEGRFPYQARFLLKGTLAEIAATAEASSGQVVARGKAVFTPFRPVPVKGMELRARGIDPAQFAKNLPHGDMSAAVTLETGPDGALHGRVEAANATPGSLDLGRLPFKRFSGTFSGRPEQLSLHDLLIDLDRAGQFRGDGSFAGGRLGLDVVTDNLDLRGLYGKLVHTDLRGALVLGVGAKAQTLAADLSQGRYRIKLDAAYEKDRLTIRSASARSGPGVLELKGEMALSGARAFRAEGALARFNPARFGDYPDAQVSASFAASGVLAPQWQAALEFTIRDSSWRGQPLEGGGALKLSASRIRQGDVELRLAGNRLAAKGAFGAPGDRLAWQLDASRLAALGPEFGGSVAASGSLQGTFARPSGTFALSGKGLRWMDQRIATLHASGKLDQGVDGQLALAAQLVGYHSPTLTLARAALKVQGSRARHEIEISAANAGLDMEARASGGWREGAGWSGWVESFSNRGRYALSLKAPARLAVGGGGFALQRAVLGFAGGHITIQDLSRRGGRWATSGEIGGLQVEKLPGLAAEPPALRVTLSLGGKWSITAEKALDGSVDLWREGGDLTVPADPPLDLGLTRLAFHATAAGSVVSATLDAAGTRLGTLSAQGRTTASRRNGAWGLAGGAPLWLEADADMPSIAWLGPLLNQNLSVGGALNARLSVAGTVGAPRFGGVIEGDKLQLALPGQGVDFRGGSLRAELHEDKLLLRRMVLRAGGGTLSAEGGATLAKGAPQLQITLVADKLEALARPDRHLVLSGGAEVSLRDKRLEVSGSLKADRGLVELPKAGAPTLSPDVVVLGRPPKPEKRGLPYRLRLDMKLDLGDRFYLKGRGVDAQLAGTVRVRAGEAGLPRANGTIRVVKGSYLAYGQRLTIERGELNFAGPIDNPGLNIVALRKNQPVEAGVAITGTAIAPRIKLVSNPSVPDSEKLAWLVLGHGLAGAGGEDFSLMQAAAGALLSQGESVTLQSQITQATGLDEFGLRGGGGLEGMVVTLGKRLSSRVYVSYEQGLSGAANLVKINLALSKWLSVRAQAGTDSAVDLFYTFSFD